MRRIIVYYCIHRAAAVVIFIIILKLNRSIFVHCCSVMMMMIMYSMNKCEHIFLKSIYFVIDYLLLILCGFLFSCLIWLLLTATPTFTSTHAHNHAKSFQSNMYTPWKWKNSNIFRHLNSFVINHKSTFDLMLLVRPNVYVCTRTHFNCKYSRVYDV